MVIGQWDNAPYAGHLKFLKKEAKSVGTFLKGSAFLVGLCIVGLAGLRLAGFDFGVRTSQNIFSGQVGSLSIFSWLILLLGLAEATILIALYTQKSRF